MIEVEHLTKTYKGRKKKRVDALRDVSFTCRPGEVFGLLGPNGAGKTTALRIISTALRPTSGTAKVMGEDIKATPREVRRRIGFLSANTGLYGRLSPREVLGYFGRLFGLSQAALRARMDELVETFQMAEFMDRHCDKLSTGMRQKVNIARTVIHSPPVMVLDEPTTGLDVLTRRSIVQFIRDSREAGHTVLFSTHIMEEVEKLCDRLAIIHDGEKRFDGTLGELRQSYAAMGGKDGEGDDLDGAFIQLIATEAETEA